MEARDTILFFTEKSTGFTYRVRDELKIGKIPNPFSIFSGNLLEGVLAVCSYSTKFVRAPTKSFRHSLISGPELGSQERETNLYVRTYLGPLVEFFL